jgi:hypothetical protein
MTTSTTNPRRNYAMLFVGIFSLVLFVYFLMIVIRNLSVISAGEFTLPASMNTMTTIMPYKLAISSAYFW